MGCATSLVKYIVFIFNFLFVLAAIAFIVIGVLIKLGIKDATVNFPEINAVPILMIVVGCVVFIIAFFGCCGAIRESTCMLTTYAVILLALLIAQIAIGVFAFVNNKEANFNEKEVSDALKVLFDDYDSGAKEAVDTLQKESKCCGVEGPLYWGLKVPDSCCDGASICTAINAYKEGCAPKVYDFLTKSMKIIGIVIIAIAAVELLGAIVALCLSSSIRNNERRGHYA